MANFAVSIVENEIRVNVGENTLAAANSATAAAASAADAAQSAAYAGGFETPEYASQSAGDAATTAGQIFRVPIGTAPQTFNWYRRLSSGSELVDPLATSAALAGPGGSAGLGFLQSGTGAVATTSEEKHRRSVSAFDFLSASNKSAALAGELTESAGTAAVQAAINSLPAVGGGHVHIENGVKFNLKALTPPTSQRLTMSYRLDDDTSVGLPSENFASNERVFFSSSSSYPADSTGAIVNEERYEATFHPGRITGVRKDLSNLANSGLAPSQSLTNPVRVTPLAIADEQLDTFAVTYINFDTKSNFSGVFIRGYRRVYRLNGIGTAQWSSVPPVGTTITGTTSGAKGFVLSVQSDFTDVEWFSGAFVAGETVSDNNETTTATITSAVRSVPESAWLANNPVNGAWVFGDLPPGSARHQLTVGGNVRLAPTRGGATHIPESVANPAIFWGNSIEAETPHQLGIRYLASGAETSRRLDIVDTDRATSLGVISPYSAMAYFGNSVIPDSNWHNIQSATRHSTGRYDLVYAQPLKRAFGIPSLCFMGVSAAGFTAVLDFMTTTSVSLFVYNASGALADIPEGAQVCFKMSGTDIP